MVEFSSSGNAGSIQPTNSNSGSPTPGAAVGGSVASLSIGSEEFKQAHNNSDVDTSHAALHHTLGFGVLQAVPSSILNNIAPIGEIKNYAGSYSTVPKGFLVCDGSSLDISAYPQLFSVIGYTYGGSGSSFNLPDTRLRSLIGAETSGAISANDTLVVGSRYQQVKVVVPLHNHTISVSGTISSAGGHSHTVSMAAGGTHTHGASSDNHTHNHGGATGTPSGTASVATGGSTAGGPNHTHSISDATHSHTITTTTSGSGHTHNATADAVANHSHSFTSSSPTTTGDKAAVNVDGNFIPYMKVAHIIRYSWGS